MERGRYGSRPDAAVAIEPRLGGPLSRSPLAEFFSPPAMTSLERPGWNRILLELHQADGWEGEACLPFHLVSLLLRPPGRLSCRFDGGRTLSGRPSIGCSFIVPAGRSHWGAWEEHTDFLLAYIAPEALARAVRDDGLEANDLDLEYCFQAHDGEIASLMLALRSQLTSPGAEDHLYVDTIGVQLAVHLLRRYGTAPLRLREYRRGLSRAKLHLVLDYLNAHLDRNILLVELADLVEMSQFHFLRQFRVSSGKTPHQYLVERRVEVATSILLHEDVSLADVAYRVGFADQSHLTRHFRRIMGAPPGQVRRQGRPVS